jgi:hypothetical protein
MRLSLHNSLKYGRKLSCGTYGCHLHLYNCRLELVEVEASNSPKRKRGRPKTTVKSTDADVLCPAVDDGTVDESIFGFSGSPKFVQVRLL